MVEGTLVSLAKHIECVAYIDSRYVHLTINSIYYYVIRYINPRIYSIYFAEAKRVETVKRWWVVPAVVSLLLVRIMCAEWSRVLIKVFLTIS